MTGQHIDRDALRKLADAATPGPWEVHGSLIGIGRAEPDFGQTWGLRWRQDIEFICAARTAVPALLDQLDQQEARIQVVRDVLDNVDDTVVTQADGVHVPVYIVRRALEG